MVTIDAAQEPPNGPAFLAARSNAIESYAQVEQALCEVFAYLLGTQSDLAGIVFYRITNAHSRNSIIETLLEKKHKTRFEHYWSGIPGTPHKKALLTLIRQLDSSRNEIVHWHVLKEVFVDGGAWTSELKLMRPHAWAFDTEAQTITLANMRAFSEKAEFVSRSLTMFRMFVGGTLRSDAPDWQAWHDIFQQPCTYPPSDSHPLAPKPSAPQTPPESSQG